MNLRRIFDLQGLNWWYVIGGMGMNFILSIVLAMLRIRFLNFEQEQTQAMVEQTVLMLGTFVITLLTGWLVGKMAGEKGPTYGIVCSAGSLMVIVPSFGISLITLMLVVISLAGGLNGGLMSARSRKRHYKR